MTTRRLFVASLSRSQACGFHTSSFGSKTPTPENVDSSLAKTPFHFETGYALRPKRPSRPFPPPFVSIPSSSFSDPLTTHFKSQDRRPKVGGEIIRGLTNGDDAILAADNFLGVNDGVGAWATKPHGHAALWSRLILHFWALECERRVSSTSPPDTIAFLQHAYEETLISTNQWLGTTTSATALLHTLDEKADAKPVLYVTNIGDCQILVIRPRDKKILFKSREQWHWFDCPYQLGTNSVDQPQSNAVLNTIELQEGDIVLAVSDGVIDNLWDHEVLTNVLESIDKWDTGDVGNWKVEREVGPAGSMVFAATRLLNAALAVAQDPFAESPYMEKAIDEGLTIEGGKMDDISVVIGQCKKRTS
ncbi:phosphatase 2C-like domain-containing protein [Talaromyces proteolyticus]|uniref:Protein phosphatase n=1 Tax=Talaromyces proteolyticus TaxID=1131652 RepID=A0AAD4KZI7_9EURO|nr:phosphatase 2C-like domain-containing protein [Talaromyces proteolyticus]KAH8700695.1 phosphatase 2C-like domain-containing protein [Talaromyces proteolyticus]